MTLSIGSTVTGSFTVAASCNVGDISRNPPPDGTIAVSKSTITGQRSIFIDFGAANLTTTADPARTWNDVTPTIGTSNTAVLNPLVGNDGSTTGARLEMIRRFNSANSSGSTTATVFPRRPRHALRELGDIQQPHQCLPRLPHRRTRSIGEILAHLLRLARRD